MSSENVEKLCEVVGFNATLWLLVQYPDQHLHIPKDARKSDGSYHEIIRLFIFHKIEESIAVQMFEALQAEFDAPGNVWLPSPDKIIGRVYRQWLVRDLMAHGVPTKVATALTGMGPKRVQDLYKLWESSARQQSNQIELL